MNKLYMPKQIDSRSWTLDGWLQGMVGLYAAFCYVMGWYFLFSAPLLFTVILLAAIINACFSVEFATSLGFASFVLSPFSIWFLTWQLLSFFGPAYIDLFRSAGIFTQRAHLMTPESAIAMVRKRRVYASNQLSALFRGLSSLFKGDQS